MTWRDTGDREWIREAPATTAPTSTGLGRVSWGGIRDTWRDKSVGTKHGGRMVRDNTTSGRHA